VREGLEAFLSIGAAYLFQQASNQALWEGVLALSAAVVVGTLPLACLAFAALFGHRRTAPQVQTVR
jgi:high-affinity Fe2+/Pb2+ permease